MRLAARLMIVLTAVLAAMATFSSPASAALVDNYKWRTDTTNAADSWGFTRRQCVSFAAQRLSERRHSINTRLGYGNASNWDEVARKRGVKVTATPKVGAIAHWNAYEKSTFYINGNNPSGWMQAGGYGHVGYVAAVYSDGSAKIEQYNMSGNRSYNVARVKAPRYLYLS